MRLRTQLFVFSAVLLLAIAMAPIAKADCKVAVVLNVNAPDGIPAIPSGDYAAYSPAGPSGLKLNQEGLAERPADLLIYDDGTTPNCFTVNNDLFRITYNAPITIPNPNLGDGTGNPSAPAEPIASDYFDVIDSQGANGLTITAVTTTTLGMTGPQSVITISVSQIGTAGNPFTGAAGSALRLKNIRLNASTLSVGSAVLATVSATYGRLSVAPTPTFQVGTALTTIAPSPSLDAGRGEQDANGGLYDNAEINWTEGFGGSFRVACPSVPCSQVANDINTTATSVIFSVTGLPNLVQLSVPSTLTNADGTLTYSQVSGGSTCTGVTGGGTCDFIYNTATDAPTVSDPTPEMIINTAASASPGGGGSYPTFGVNIPDPSGWGIVDVAVQFGPATHCQTSVVSDDCDPTPLPANPGSQGRIPKYVDSISPTAGEGGTRLIVNGDWFDIEPIRTVLLYPLVTNLGGFGTGISVANTGEDCTLASPETITTCAFLKEVGPPASIVPDPTHFHAGVLTFFVFPNGGAPFTVPSTALVGATGCTLVNCGLDSLGNLQPGNVMAVGLATLLTAGGQGALLPDNFDGYIIVVAEFNYGHGDAVVFTPGGIMSTYGALILGKQQRVGKHGRQAEHLDQ